VWEGCKVNIDQTISIDYDPICIAIEATTGALTGAFAGTDPTTTVGGATGDILPHQTQGLGRLSTSTVFGGRRLRGRLFIPGPPESVNSAGGLPTSSYTTTLTTALGTLFTAGATASQAVIWHRPQGGTGGGSAPITGVSAAPAWSVLRSRR